MKAVINGIQKDISDNFFNILLTKSSPISVEERLAVVEQALVDLALLQMEVEKDA